MTAPRRPVLGAVILHQHPEVFSGLRSQRCKLLRQVGATVIAGQQHVDHHFHPHLWKYLKMEDTCRRLPRRVRVFSRAQAWVTTMSG